MYIRYSRLSCRVFNPHFGTLEHSEIGTFGIRTNSAFGEIQLSDKFGLRLNFDVGYALLLIFYLDQIRNFYFFFVKTFFHPNICHDHKHKKFFKISFSALRGKEYLQN